jgi:hypothetical protein
VTDDAVGVVTRWEDAGGEWRVVARTATTATVALCRCDGGEEVDRFTSTDPALLEFLAVRSSDGD